MLDLIFRGRLVELISNEIIHSHNTRVHDYNFVEWSSGMGFQHLYRVYKKRRPLEISHIVNI
jgi:hypothetical protein